MRRYPLPRHLGSAALLEPTQSFRELHGLRVVDAMHHGLVSCPPETSLRSIARMLSSYRVHALLVLGYGENDLPRGTMWGVVSDADVLQAAETGSPDEQTAGLLAATPAVTVRSDDDLPAAAELMTQRRISHLIVVDPASERPVGMLSTHDVMRALAGFPERHPATP